MSQAETLLQSLTDNIPAHTHVVTDQDSYFVINPDTREIENASRTKNVLMQFDHNSEKFTFELARYVEGHDMTLCNRVRVHFNNIDGTTNEENADVAELYDLAVDPEDESKVLCSWTITRQATQLVGTLNFLVQYECIDDAGNSVYEWHTDIYDKVLVKQSRNNAEQAVIEYSNVLEQWYQRIFGTGDAVLENIANAGEAQILAVAAEGDTQKEAIALKGEATLATIPEDYTTTYNMAEKALRRKANAIELEAGGESIFVDNASDTYLLGLNMYGKTEQITTTGKNLCPGYKKGAYNNSTGEYSTEFTGYYCTEKTPVTHGINYVISNGLARNPSLIHAYDVDDNWLGSTTLNNLPANVAFIGVNYLVSDDLKWIQIEVGTEATDYEPYSGGMASPNPEYPQKLESVENTIVSIYGKNLVDSSNVVRTVHSKVSTEDNKIHVQKTNTGSVYSNFYYVLGRWENFVGRKLTVHVENVTSYNWTLNVGDIDETNNWVGSNLVISRTLRGTEEVTVTFTVPEKETATNLGLRFVSYDTEVSSETYTLQNLQVEFGDTATEYEPYKPAQSLTINHALSGIPVTSGGNYTDSNGQQWICDEIDFERGMYVQRVYRAILNENTKLYSYRPENNTDTYIGVSVSGTPKMKAYGMSKCSFLGIGTATSEGYFPNTYMVIPSGGIYMRVEIDGVTDLDTFKTWLANNPQEVQYVLATPIETPLTDEEIAYYKALKTNYPNTTVINDHNAHMAIKYAADTLIYLRDNQPKPTDEQIQAAVNEYASQNGVQVPSDEHIQGIAEQAAGSVLTDDEVTSLLSMLN